MPIAREFDLWSTLGRAFRYRLRVIDRNILNFHHQFVLIAFTKRQQLVRAAAEFKACSPFVEIPELRIPEAVVNQISEGAVWSSCCFNKNARRPDLTTNGFWP